jgi:hypothetical protein
VPLYTAQISQAEWDGVAHHPLVVRADLMPGSDAGLKIQAAIAALPVGVGGFVDATGFTNPQSLTGFHIPPGVTVKLSPVYYTLVATGPSITLDDGGRLLGSGRGNPGGTHVRASNGFNKALITCISRGGETGWWHHGEVRNIRLDGNKAQNTRGHGIEVYNFGETSTLRDVNIHDATECGVYVKGSQSGTNAIYNVTTNACGVAGLCFDQFRSAFTCVCVGGDNNPVTLLVKDPGMGGGALKFVDLKSEGAVGPVIRIQGGSARVTLGVSGGNFLCLNGVPSTAIEITADVRENPVISLETVSLGNTVPTLVQDRKNGKVVTVGNYSYLGYFHYCAGVWQRFDQDGFTASIGR